MKKAAISGGRSQPLDTLSRSPLYKSVRVVHIVIVEDVLVLAYLDAEEAELRELTDSALAKLRDITDAEYAALDLTPDFDL